MMHRKQKLFIFVGVAIVVIPALAIYLYWLMSNTPEREIKKQLRRIAKAIMHKDYVTLRRGISAEYNGSIGSSRESVLLIAQEVLERVTKLRIKIRSIEVTFNGINRAHLRSGFAYSGYYVASEIYDKIPLSGGLIEFTPGEAQLDLKKEGGIWRVCHAEIVLGEAPHSSSNR